MQNALNFVFTCISRSVSWLSEWSFLNVPFLYWLMGIAIIGILIDFIFG